MGNPRTARQFSVYKNCPLPTPEDRLFFLLTYLKTYALQVIQGRLFGMGQSKANQWIHVLLPVLLAALRTLGDAPARSPRWRSGSASRRLTPPWSPLWQRSPHPPSRCPPPHPHPPFCP
jgi:Helix-turn-helix of DDE superfamily endonuclease